MEHGRSPLSDNYGGWTHSTVCHTTPVNAQNCSLQTMWSDAQLLCIILRSRLRKSIGAKHKPTRCSHTRVGSPAQCNLHTTYTWDNTRGGEHNIPAPLWAFFVNDRSDTVSIHGPVIQFIQQLKPIKLGHFWNLNIFNSCPGRSMP